MKKFRKSFEFCWPILLSTTVVLTFFTSENICNGTEIIDSGNNAKDLYFSSWNCCMQVPSIQIVDCSYSKYIKIPTCLPNTTEQLTLRGNYLYYITKADFTNLRSLIYLDLSNCSIIKIEPGSFHRVVRLQILNLSVNPFLESYSEHLFSSLSNLTQLFLTGTRKQCTFNLDLLQNLTKLEVLWFGSNQVFQFPKFLNQRNSTILPNLKNLSFEDNNLISPSKGNFKGLESLETLILSGNRILILHTEQFKGLKNLSRLVLDRNIYFTPGRYVFFSRSLKDLSLNYIRPQSRVANEAFNGIPNLEKLSLEQSPALFKNAFPFSQLPNLVKLNLRGTGVKSVMLETITARLPKLRYLDLTDNDIDILRNSMFHNLELNVLLIGNNWLKTVDITSLPLKTWSHLQRVDFSNNVLLECDCSIVWFRRWLRDQQNTTVDNLQDTNCSAREGNAKSTSIYHLKEPTDIKCFTDESYLCLDAVFATVVAICFLSSTTAMVYRFRWQLKYYHFQRELQSRQAMEIVDHRQFLFDAFISYSDFDRSWVINHLCTTLETGFHLRLCIRDRDWLPGQDIVDNMAESIGNSRKTVLIASNAFAVSHWCHVEMTMAQTKFCEDDRDDVVLVLLEEIADCNMNPRLQLQMQKKTCIEWTDNQIGQQLFWAQLNQALAKHSSSLINSVPPKELFVSVAS